jgi:hypothetical protein
MNYFDKHPSENRMEFTKQKVACKYASIGGVVHVADLQCVAKFYFAKRTVSLHETSPFDQL